MRDVLREAHREIVKVSPCSVLVVRCLAADALFKAL